MNKTVDVGIDSLEPRDVVVGMFDVLGFSDRVETTSLVKLLADYRALLELKLWAADVPVITLPHAQVFHAPSAVFSDTILFWADALPENVDSFLNTCSILIADGLNRGWPLRGGISAGPCVLDRKGRVFVGQPIVEAYRVEKSQEWVGAALHPSVLNHRTVGPLIANHPEISAYSVPTKAKSTMALDYAIAWPPRSYDAEEDLRRCDPGPRSPAHLKYQNAKAFAAAFR